MIKLIEYIKCKMKLHKGNPDFGGHHYNFVSGKCIYCKISTPRAAQSVWNVTNGSKIKKWGDSWNE